MAYNDFRIKLSKRRISFIYVFYWLMLAYIVAALVFWFISLTKQNREITFLRMTQLEQIHQNHSDPNYAVQYRNILSQEKAKTFQYVGEGSTFLIIIIASAIFVFRMLRAQLRLSRQQKDFMMAVTHELKTPIAVTKLNLETLLKRQLEPEKQQRLIHSTLSEADRLNALCNNMLLLNEMGTSYIIANEDIAPTELINECVAEQKNRFPSRKFSINTTVQMHIYGDRMLLKLALNNLLDNAIKYSAKDTEIKVNSFQKDNEVAIQIIDEGAGIPAHEAKRVFQKYYRGAGNEAKGTGLGLYVTRQIVKQSKGRLEYQPNHPKGSIFTITFVS